MKKYFLLVLLIQLVSGSYAQNKEIRLPADIFKIIDKSTRTYSIEQLNEPVKLPDYSSKIIYPGFYKKINADGSFSINTHVASEQSMQFFNQAEKYFADRNYDSALFHYQKSYDADSNFLDPLVYMGQVYGLQKQTDKGIAVYRKVLAKNDIDYMAHWFLADLLKDKNNLKEALKEILTAHILNRNNPRILISVKIILEASGLQWNDWTFNPQYKLQEKGKDISLQYKSPWLGYAMAKAVQQFEDPKNEEAGNDLMKDYIDKEKECLLGLLVMLENDKEKDYNEKDFTCVNNAVKEKLTDEFILYETLLPSMPTIARQLPKAYIDDLVNYLVKVKFVK